MGTVDVVFPPATSSGTGLARRDTQHRIPMGDGRWRIWRDCGLRSAGFPARDVELLCDRQVADAADRASASEFGAEADEFRAIYRAATARISRELANFARSPRYREAVALQNLRLIDTCLDKLADERPGKAARRRQREMTVARYVQRYCLKNDTIGFFGPFCWATCTSDGEALTVEYGPTLLASRELYFEQWAIDQVAAVFSAGADMIPWLSPKIVDSVYIDGALARRSAGSAIGLSDQDQRVLSLCNGTSTVRSISERLLRPGPGCQAQIFRDDHDVRYTLDRLRQADVISIDLTGPVEARPEQTLRRRLHDIGDGQVRSPRLAALDDLIGARDRAEASAGNAAGRIEALGGLNSKFEQMTALSAARRHGQAYVGRTIVYEDAARNVQATLGGPLLEALAAPLSPLLDSARWLIEQIAAVYRKQFDRLYQRYTERTGTDNMMFGALVAAATPDLAFSYTELPELVVPVVREFQRKWARILDVPADAHECMLSASSITAAVEQEFASGIPSWSQAVHYSPDIMIAARDAAAVNQDEYLLVLGELHLAINTLENRCVVELHREPARLLAAAEADHGKRRVVPVPSRDSELVNSRTYPSALLSDQYTYWCMYPNGTGAPGAIRPAAEMTVLQVADRLVVRSRKDGQEFDLLEFLGGYLTPMVGNAFKLFTAMPHHPRIVIDNLVVSRESWSIPFAELQWAFIKDEAQRYRAARIWRKELGIGERVFYSAPSESKPIFVDFTSPVLVDVLGRVIRGSADAADSAMLTVTEMLPDVGQSWLRDLNGSVYTSELRLVVVDPAAGSLGE
jgi:Lantibiotic dehydratase, N terminus